MEYLLTLHTRRSGAQPTCKGPEPMRSAKDWTRSLDQLNKDNREDGLTGRSTTVPYILASFDADPKRLRYCETCEQFLRPRSRHTCPAVMSPTEGQVFEEIKTQKVWSGIDRPGDQPNWHELHDDPKNWTTLRRVLHYEITSVVNPSKDPYWPGDGDEDREIVFFTVTHVSGWEIPWTEREKKQMEKPGRGTEDGNTYEMNYDLSKWRARHGEGLTRVSA